MCGTSYFARQTGKCHVSLIIKNLCLRRGTPSNSIHISTIGRLIDRWERASIMLDLRCTTLNKNHSQIDWNVWILLIISKQKGWGEWVKGAKAKVLITAGKFLEAIGIERKFRNITAGSFLILCLIYLFLFFLASSFWKQVPNVHSLRATRLN